MRKFGLIAAVVGFCILASDLLLRVLAHSSSWLWLPGFLLLTAGSALLLWSHFQAAAVASPTPSISTVVTADTARLLDNFEQRFAELKGRKPNATVLADLYTLGTQLEQRGRTTQATAVYRHLARFDNTYRDVGARLRRLMDAERAKPKAAPPAAAKSAPSLDPAVKAAEASATAAAAAAVTAAGGVAAAPAAPDTQRLGRY